MPEDGTIENGTAEDETAGSEPTREAPEFETGRYLYCVVDASDGGSLPVTGLDDEPVSLVVESGVGAVVQPCDSPYDSDDVAEVRDWLLTHQEVVDEAGETFGTPLPFRFDTILTGDDDAVRSWLRSQHGTLADHLADLADHWEYRVSVSWDEDAVREEIESDDEELADLRERIDDANEGTAFMLEKQYERRFKELRADRRRQLVGDLRDRLDPLVRTIEEADDRGNVLGESSPERVAQLTFLAHEDREEEIGSELDEVAAEPGVEIRFTGPWPPYSFAPELEA